jgi:exonuclease SbcC
MRPIRLEIENLRSFKKKRIINFDGLELFAILGDTGAGKTSILEAITYALFNRSTWSGTNVKELISKGAAAMAVTFAFSVDGDEFTVTRITKDRGIPQHRLSCPARGIDVASEADVKDEVRKALHFDASAFLHTVLLPQGKHAELLTSSGGERNKILGELFRLDEIPRVQEEAKFHVGQAEAYLHGLNKERAVLPLVPGDALALAEESIVAATGNLEKVTAAAEQHRTLTIAIDVKQKALEETKLRSEQLRGVDEIPERLAAIAEIEKELRDAAAVHIERKLVAEAAKAHTDLVVYDLETRGLDRESVRLYETVLNRVESASREIAREESSHKEKTLLSKAAAKNLDELTKRRKEVVSEHENARELLTRADLRLVELRRNKEQLDLLNGSYRAARKTQLDREGDLRVKKEFLKGAGKQSQATNDALIAAVALQQQTANAVEQAQLASGAAAVAAHLHSGDDCPVCKRKLPASFSPPKDVDLKRSRLDDASAQTQLRKAEADKVRLDTEIQSQVQAERECKSRFDHAKKEADLAKAALEMLLPTRTEDPDAVLRSFDEQISELEGDIPDLKAAFEKAANRAASIETEIAKVVQQLSGYRESLDALAKSIEGRKLQRTKDVESLPAAFSPGLDGASIDVARKAIKTAIEETKRCDEAITSANSIINETTAKLSEIERSRSTSIVAPRAGLHERLQRMASLIKAAPLPKEEAEQAEWAETIVRKAREEMISLDAQATEARRLQQLGIDARQALISDLGADPQEALTTAAIQLEGARRTLVETQRSLDRIREIAAKIERLEPTKVGLETLRDELGARRFAKFATEQRQKRLLEVGTMIFADMTSGRYAFTKDFQIWDDVTNEERPPQTLSGGEKFLASLALSLAVVEIAANAGAKIESLFLDEGFASLDSETLEMAMMELKKRSRAGRSICVISHLSEVTKFVSDTFLVKAREEGSEVQHIEGPLDDDADVIAGLVTQLTVNV